MKPMGDRAFKVMVPENAAGAVTVRVMGLLTRQAMVGKDGLAVPVTGFENAVALSLRFLADQRLGKFQNTATTARFTDGQGWWDVDYDITKQIRGSGFDRLKTDMEEKDGAHTG